METAQIIWQNVTELLNPGLPILFRILPIYVRPPPPHQPAVEQLPPHHPAAQQQGLCPPPRCVCVCAREKECVRCGGVGVWTKSDAPLFCWLYGYTMFITHFSHCWK